MSAGRWLDDAYGGQPRPGTAGPRLLKYMKWTWPLMVVAAVALTAAVGQAGWIVALVGWFATCAVPNHLDTKAHRP